MPITFANDPSHQRAGLPGRNDDWDDYMKALEQQDEWFQNRSKYKLSVLGETESYRHTISELRKVAQGDWDTLTEKESKCLLGLGAYKDGWPLLGKMWHTAHEPVFKNRRKIGAAVTTVVKGPDNEAIFLKAVITAYREICSINGVSGAIASRLLTLARPDRCVSVNNGSRLGLAAAFDLDETTLHEAGSYQGLLRRVYRRRWFQAPEPEDPVEREIWSMRAALLDCFVYWPKQRNETTEAGRRQNLRR